MSQYTIMWLTMKLPLHPLIGPWFLSHSGEYWMTFGNFLRYYNNCVRSNLVAATAFNRLTALAVPIYHRKVSFI
uniref:Secreted protein n=1 Tax=Panagrellus redivivus TaxID=6233 RepID=A0A7E4UN86_PANRE